METRQCQNCKTNFHIEPEDFVFYEKIKVPSPTWCPECRLQRRMMFRNEMNLYRKRCECHGKEVFSSLPQESPIKILEPEQWNSDNWDSMSFGREYSFSRPFFYQLKDLIHAIPRPSRTILRLIDSDYCNNASDLKNCYLLFNSETSENCAYGNGITDCQEVFDSYFMKQCERCYEGFVCYHSYDIFFSSNITDSYGVYFSDDLAGCSDCFGCVGLRNKHHMIFNVQYSPEEYIRKLKEFKTGANAAITEFKEKSHKLRLSSPVAFMHGRQNVDVSGDYIAHSRRVWNSFFVDEFENCRFCFSMGLKPTRDCYDFCWGGASELVYEAIAVGLNTSNLRFVYELYPDCFDQTYCGFCPGSSHLFACVGLRNKSYCILNKQYTKEEYEKLVPKIIQHMNDMPYTDSRGRVYKYGEFFPPELSPFAYNETIAQEYFPLTKEQAIEKGYQWREPEQKQYKITMTTDQIPDHIKDVPDSITNEVIQCGSNSDASVGVPIEASGCTTAFKIIPQELDFYRKMNLPLPRLCPNCRHYQRVKQRNPLKLWHRKCQCAGKTSDLQPATSYPYQNQSSHFHGSSHCLNEFETSYAPERPEIVYCEQCYNSEVV